MSEANPSSSTATENAGNNSTVDDDVLKQLDYTNVQAPIMFGDLFGTRGDYSTGVFYAGRRKFIPPLRPISAKDSKPNTLKPPDLFMTRQQTRKHIKSQIKSDGVSNFKILAFNSVSAELENKAIKADLIRKQEGQKMKRLLMKH